MSSLRVATGMWGQAVLQPQHISIGCITSPWVGATGRRRRAVPQQMAACICADEREEATGGLQHDGLRSVYSFATVEPAYIPAAGQGPS